MKVLSTAGITKLIQLIKSTFISVDNTEVVSEIETETPSEVTLASVAISGRYSDLSNKPIIPTAISELTNDRGYITGVAWGDVSGTLSNQTDLYNELYYKAGDTFSGGNGQAIGSIMASGCLTASRGSLFFSFALPKRLTNVSTVTINSIIGGVRGADGGYIAALGTDFSTIGTLTATIASDNYVTIYIQLNTASTQTNNTPISVMMYSVSLSFS